MAAGFSLALGRLTAAPTSGFERPGKIAAQPCPPPPPSRSSSTTCSRAASTTWRARRRSSPRTACRAGSATPFSSSARTCSRSSASSCAAPTTRSPTSPRPRRAAASSPPAPATTPRAWPTRPASWGCAPSIVMPQTTPQIKVDAVKSMGAEVVLIGDSYADAQAHCDLLIAETGMTFVHPFDDPLVIAGQGTVGAEILRHSQDSLNAVFVPVGGGGLISGIAGYIKSLRPDVKVIGVEPFEADAMYRSLRGRHARAAGSRGHLRRRRGGARGGPAHVRHRAADGGRSGARDQRRGVRGHQGHLRRHAVGDGAGRRAGHRRPAQVGGARGRAAGRRWWRC